MPIPVVCIGNITLGGAGKTPTVIFLANYFKKNNIKAHVVSRGYGGIYKDVVFVDFDYTFKSKETGTTWRFSTGKSKDLLVGNPVYDDNPYRECSSTQKLESILKNVLEYQL